MRQKNKGEGTKIAQAAKELNVTSVTIRRYLTEFNIETTSDENGIKVLPASAMEELQEIRKLKEDGLTNPKVLEILEERRSKPEPVAKTSRAKAQDKDKEKEREKEKEKPAAETPRRATRKTDAAPPVRATRKVVVEREVEEEAPDEDDEEVVAPPPVRTKQVDTPAADSDEEGDDEESGAQSGDGKSKYSLTCQTCQKVFEHMNPRLRDCLDCYRIKRKERRRGGDKKNVIQNPLAQQVVSKNQQAAAANRETRETRETAAQLDNSVREITPIQPVAAARPSIRETLSFAPPGTVGYQRPQVRNYRKAIEETRGITSNLKRRLERPDLPEAERRFLEQIYAYQLILHQGWRHLAEYKSGGTEGRD